MKQTNRHKVSIIILNWNGLKDTIECLESLKKITYPNYEVIIVDNGSEGNDADVLKEKYKGYIRLIRNKENLGFMGGNNIGIKEAIKEGADYVLLLNNDTIVEPDFLDELVKVASQDEKIAIVGSVIADYYTKKILFTNGKIDKKLKLKSQTDYLKSNKIYWETEAVQGSSMMMRVESILKHNLFLDKNLFLYCEEIDICIRTKKAGLKIAVAGKSIVYHKEGRSYGGGIKPFPIYYVLRNRIILSKKLLNTKDKIIFWLLFTPSRIFKLLLWILTGRRGLVKATYVAFRDGILNNGGPRKL